MAQFKITKNLIIFMIILSISALVFMTVNVSAEEPQKTIKEETQDFVYKIEIDSSPDFSKIKADILAEDLKYVAFPEKLENDILLSEIIESDVDYTSKDVQKVNFYIQRFVESKSEKTKIDEVVGKVKLQFVDTTAPTITLSKKSITHEVESKLDENDYLKSVEDNSFDKVSVSIKNNVDLKIAGDYKITYTAVDSSDNSASAVLNVTVKDKPKPKPVVVKASSAATTYTAKPSSNDIYGALNMINAHRVAAGLHPLVMGGGSELAAASIRAQEAASYVSHTRPGGRSYKTAFTDLGLYHSNVIEVLTYSGSSAADKVNWWMRSSTHRGVLMRSNITHIALGTSGGMWAGIVYQ